MTTPTVDMVLLNRAKTGNEMLAILDTLVTAPVPTPVAEPTLTPVKF
jgi:hypothetical protein